MALGGPNVKTTTIKLMSFADWMRHFLFLAENLGMLFDFFLNMPCGVSVQYGYDLKLRYLGVIKNLPINRLSHITKQQTT